MRVFKNLSQMQLNQLIVRNNESNEQIISVVSEIVDEVKAEGDQALNKYSLKYDGFNYNGAFVSEQEFEDAGKCISDSLKEAISMAKNNIFTFHKNQQQVYEIIETQPGVKCWQKAVPIEKVGLYIPGGTAPLISTVLMLGIPAKIAECKEVILCTPPDKSGNINPAILYTANLLGINKVFKAGGAQAIAAMAYGTETIPKVDKIFGPGNQYVTAAKQYVSLNGTAIDMPAGPSELLVIADETANPDFVAADLLSQLEHGIDSQVVLLSSDEKAIEETIACLKQQIKELPRKDIAAKALENSFAILLKDLNECIQWSDRYAPEHLILNCIDAPLLAQEVANAGSVFIGQYAPESAGDYASGTNHTLPTNGYARMYSGLSTESFCKVITYQNITEEGIRNIGPCIEEIAEAEQLQAHKNAVTIRLKSLND
ncbi:MAG: histidinol dehydrogenase [Marinilabiliales bacterium]|nr:MAG: histidinol dehydrogenase [Marinilabiliales bacterium]